MFCDNVQKEVECAICRLVLDNSLMIGIFGLVGYAGGPPRLQAMEQGISRNKFWPWVLFGVRMHASKSSAEQYLVELHV